MINNTINEMKEKKDEGKKMKKKYSYMQVQRSHRIIGTVVYLLVAAQVKVMVNHHGCRYSYNILYSDSCSCSCGYGRGDMILYYGYHTIAVTKKGLLMVL